MLECSSTSLLSFTLVSFVNCWFMDILFSYYCTMCILSLLFWIFFLGVMLSLLVPPLYEKYQDHVDEKLGVAHSVLSRHIDTIITRAGQAKQKKTE